MLWSKAFFASKAVCVALMCVACTSESSDNNEAAPARSELKCHATVIEPDLDSNFVFGSAVDMSTGTLGAVEEGREYVVSSTYGIPKPGPDGMPRSQRHQALMGQIIEKLQTQPGLVALQLSTSTSCNSGRTLAVWESEELMYAFVTTGPHLEAMSAAEELLQPGYAVTHWTASSRDEMTLMAAPEHLAESVEE